MDKLDHILHDWDQRDDYNDELKEWYCVSCEHGPMAEKLTRCTRCGTRQGTEWDEWTEELDPEIAEQSALDLEEFDN